MAVRSSSKTKSSGRRELKNTGSDKRYVRRDSSGSFSEVDDVGRSLSQDIKRRAKTKVSTSYGDRGDSKHVSRK